VSGAGLVLAVVGVVLGLVHAVLPDDEDRVVTGRSIRPGAHGAPLGLWARLLNRPTRAELVAAPVVLALYVLSGLARLAAIGVRLADLAIERAARAADIWSDPDS
jgi:hypothetical protein